MANYIDRPGLDQAEIISDGRIYPVVMSILIRENSVLAQFLGLISLEYDSIIIEGA